MIGHNRIRRKLRRMRQEVGQKRLRAAGWYDPSARSSARAIFIGGCGRSGTTVFKEILNRHPRIACGPETSMFGLPFDPRHIAPYWEVPVDELRASMTRSGNLVRFAEAFYGAFAEREGKARWADKTPNNVRALPKILTWFPESRFIHVVRDGRDVVCSLRNHPRERVENGKIVPVRTVNPISKCCERWLRDTCSGRAFLRHPRCLEVQYERLVCDPEDELRRVCEFIGENFDPMMLRSDESNGPRPAGQVLNNPRASTALQASSVGRWKRDLSRAERDVFVNMAGELLISLGYVHNHSWTDLGMPG